jgi:primosomal protein N' (replication factor Y)
MEASVQSLFGKGGDEGSTALAAPALYARVAVERGLDTAPEGLTYASAWTDLEVGERVEVPLGRGDRRTGGIVVAVGGEELLGGLSKKSVKRIASRSGAKLPGPLVKLALWMAEYYVCPLGMVLATMMPSAVKKRVGRHVEKLVDVSPDAPRGAGGPAAIEPKLTPAMAEAWKGILELEVGALPAEPRALAIRLGLGSVGPINRLVARGLLRRVERESVRSRAGDAALELLGGGRVERPTLTEAQTAAVEGIAGSLGSFAVHLLYGVTGSGKTEVYLRVIERALAAGKSALVLVPEIALTPQTAGRFLGRFGGMAGGTGGVAVLHSGLSAGERHRQWAMAAGGLAKVVVGARSAVFAPVANLGVIVVDEEHDSSFKQDQLPRYHGRDVAIKRGQVEGCPVVLGSATPSLESWANAVGMPGVDGAAGRARYRLWRLPERVGLGRMPEVRIVDMADERRRSVLAGEGRPGSMIGPTLTEELARTLHEGGQAILLLNRRGYATHVCCSSPACGWTLLCHACDAALVLHKDQSLPRGGLVRCHHCLGEELVPKGCPVCGRPPARLGTGTQRVEEELVSMGLEERDLLRVDSDSMDSARDYFDALSKFGRGEVKVLLGTQMVAKGLDFPNVRLVGVLSADTSLHIPDFRAGERTFQLICQVAGRAGRGEHAGLVIVQTMSPREPAIVMAGRHDYEAFATSELAMRVGTGLPPASRMARIVTRDEDHQAAMEHADRIAGAMREEAGLGDGAAAPGMVERREPTERQASSGAGHAERPVSGFGGPGAITVMGPMDCAVGRIAGQYRVAVEVIAPTAGVLHGLLAGLRGRRLLKSDAHTAVDVDPVSLM